MINKCYRVGRFLQVGGLGWSLWPRQDYSVQLRITFDSLMHRHNHIKRPCTDVSPSASDDPSTGTQQRISLAK